MKRRIKNNFEVWGLFSILFLNLVLLSIPLFRTSLLPGFDSPFYLYVSSLIVPKEAFWQTIFSPRLIDRSLTFLLPAIVSLLPGMTPLVSLKFFLLTIGLLQTLGIYLLGRKLYGVRVGLASAFVSGLIIGFWRIFQDLYANLFAASLVPFIFLFLIKGFEESKTKKCTTWVLSAGVLTGLLFYVHNLTSFVIFFGVLLPWLLLRFLRARSSLLGLYLLVSLTFGFPSLSQWLPPFFQEGQQVLKIQAGSFPFMVGYFREFIQPPFATLGLVGLLWFLYDFLVRRESRSLLPLLWNFAFLAGSQQQLVGLNFLPERFVISLTQPFSLAAGVGLVKISEWLRKQAGQSRSLKSLEKSTFSFLLILVLLLSLPASLKFVIFRIKPTIDERELAVFGKISPLIGKDDLVTFSNLHHYWFQATLPSVNIEPGEFYLICGDENVASRLGARSIGMSYVLSPKWDGQTSASFLREYAQEKNFQKVFIFLNLGEKCVQARKFEENPKYFQKVYEDQNGFRLYQLLK